MKQLTSYERFSLVYEHKEPDRVPIIDGPWPATIERWHSEGMPEGTSFVDFFDLDHVVTISADNSPRYEAKIIEQTDEYVVSTSKWGATFKNWKHAASTPEFIDFTVKDPDSWREAKARMTPDRRNRRGYPSPVP